MTAAATRPYGSRREIETPIPFSAPYLNGVEVDYVSTMQSSGFAFSNPNATGGCGCGTSFTV